jgi:hypothetical protein
MEYVITTMKQHLSHQINVRRWVREHTPPAKKVRHFSLRYTFFSFLVPGRHRVHFERPLRHNVYRPFTVSVRPRVTKMSIRKKVFSSKAHASVSSRLVTRYFNVTPKGKAPMLIAIAGGASSGKVCVFMRTSSTHILIY